jgi:predicted TIM-barrel fold metal-dependent hydrolase
VRSLVDANAERLLWGSDWPHSELFASPPHDADLVEVLRDWIPDEALRRRVCVDNPARLYGYAGDAA